MFTGYNVFDETGTENSKRVFVPLIYPSIIKPETKTIQNDFPYIEGNKIVKIFVFYRGLRHTFNRSNTYTVKKLRLNKKEVRTT